MNESEGYDYGYIGTCLDLIENLAYMNGFLTHYTKETPMQQQPTLLEKECEALTSPERNLYRKLNVKGFRLNLAQVRNAIRTGLDTLTTTTEALTEQRNANLALSEDNKSLSISLSRIETNLCTGYEKALIALGILETRADFFY